MDKKNLASYNDQTRGDPPRYRKYLGTNTGAYSSLINTYCTVLPDQVNSIYTARATMPPEGYMVKRRQMTGEDMINLSPKR